MKLHSLSFILVLSSALRSLKSAPDWQQALEEAQQEGQKNPLPLEVFKVSHRFLRARRDEMIHDTKLG